MTAAQIAVAAPSAAHHLAEFADRVGRDGAPVRVMRRAADLVADQVGLQAAACRLPWSNAVVRYLRTFPTAGRCVVVGHPVRSSPEQAAFVNACFGHGQDFDDTCPAVQSHVGATIVPVALAVGTEVRASGEQVLRAVVAGAEVVLRVAHAVSPGCLGRGHHTPVAAGPFGAAVTTSLLLGAEVTELAAAMTVAGSFSGGLTEYTQAGGSVKRIHMGIPAAAGVRAAYLARFGMTGPSTVLEGEQGFCRAFTDTPEPARLTQDLGTRYLVDLVGFKRYNCCFFIQAPIEAYLSMVAETGIRADQVADVTVGTSARGVEHVGRIPVPTDPLGAQFSAHFTLGMVGHGVHPDIDSYTPEQLADPRFRAFARRVRVVEDARCTAEYPGTFSAVVTVRTHEGATFTRRVRYPRGAAENPMGPEEIAAKARRNLAAATPTVDPDVVMTGLGRIGSMSDIGELTSLLAADDD